MVWVVLTFARAAAGDLYTIQDLCSSLALLAVTHQGIDRWMLKVMCVRVAVFWNVLYGRLTAVPWYCAHLQIDGEHGGTGNAYIDLSSQRGVQQQRALIGHAPNPARCVRECPTAWYHQSLEFAHLGL